MRRSNGTVMVLGDNDQAFITHIPDKPHTGHRSARESAEARMAHVGIVRRARVGLHDDVLHKERHVANERA